MSPEFHIVSHSFFCQILDAIMPTSRKYIEDLKGMSNPQRLEAAKNLAIAVMERGGMLMKDMKSATSGPKKTAADSIRGKFPAYAAAATNVYFGGETNEQFPSDPPLPDEYANSLPAQLLDHLPKAQQDHVVSFQPSAFSSCSHE